MQVDLGDACIGYDDAGRGLPVVFLHGFPHDRTLEIMAGEAGGKLDPALFDLFRGMDLRPSS